MRSFGQFLYYFSYERILHAPKAPKAQRRNQAKAQNATSEQKWKIRLKTSEGKKVTYSLICVFVLFCAHKENKIKNRNVPTM